MVHQLHDAPHGKGGPGPDVHPRWSRCTNTLERRVRSRRTSSLVQKYQPCAKSYNLLVGFIGVFSCLPGSLLPCFLVGLSCLCFVLSLLLCAPAVASLVSFPVCGRRPKNWQSLSAIPLGRSDGYRGGRLHGQSTGALWHALFG